jgi:DNA (cytosine-5)-methyltransferase 3A
MKRNILSLFDGISGLRLSLNRAGIKYDIYYSSEIDNKAIAITQARFPDTVQLGDVRDIKSLKDIWLISAGSPCQDLSQMGKKKGMVVTTLKQYLSLKKKGYEFAGQSHLFWEFVRLVKELKPKYFFLENVSMDSFWMYVISKELGVLPVKINSSLVTAQNRNRYYWTNIPGITVPKDKGIHLSDVIDGAYTGYGTRGRINNLTGKYSSYSTARRDRKANCICTTLGNTSFIKMRNGTIRRLTISELEQLQTLPKNYTNAPGLSKTARAKGIGNGWTIDVVSHLLRPLKKV